jgi:hypothetical protein
MAQLLNGGKVKLNDGSVKPVKNGEWYDGRRFLDGKLLSPGEYEPGKFTSSEVNKQSSVAQGKTPDAIDTYLKAQGGGGQNGSASGSSGSGSNQNPLSQVNQTIQDSFQRLQDEVMKRFGEYRAGKPFRVDEVLAEKGAAAKEQIDPYYNEQLGDYLLGVTRKINRGADDTKALLTELTATTDSYVGKSGINLDESIRKAEEGYADAGLFGSGEQVAAEGQQKYTTGSDLADYTRKADFQSNQLKTGLARNNEDILAGKNDYVRNLERSRFTDEQTRTADLTKEAGQDYIRGFKSILPPELQASNGMDLLSSLGIYS